MSKSAPQTPRLEQIDLELLIPYVNNPKAHPKTQINKLASSIKNFGFLVPVVVDKGGEIVAGHGRLLAAKKLGMTSVPCLKAEHLTPAQIKAYRIADNKLAESEWFPEILTLELKALEEMEFDLGLTGFDREELEIIFCGGPNFEPGTEADQGRLDQSNPIVCPKCGHSWQK